MDVDYSPTGKEFVSAGYDKTIRIFEVHKSHSREIYHTKRMQRVTCVGWSLDNKYIFSGSDEMNIRLWKARASEKLGSVIHFFFSCKYKMVSSILFISASSSRKKCITI